MQTRTLFASAAIGLAAVGGLLFALQSFDTEAVPCDGIDEARKQVQSLYDQGVNTSVEVYRDQKAMIDDELSRCLNAKPMDPCAEAQQARDQAVQNYNAIPSPSENASYAEFQTYYQARETAYQQYKTAKEQLENCRANNPLPQGNIPYEQSDTKKCFDAYDVSVESIRNTFETNTQALRAALKAVLEGLNAREKACHPPTGEEAFTDPPSDTDETRTGAGISPVELANCQLLNSDLDSELLRLRQRAAQLPGEIAEIETSIDNANNRLNKLKRDLSEVDTYIPPESTKTQFEGALNALRAERKVSIESQIEFYNGLISRKKAEKAQLETELKNVQSQINARVSQIQKENEARQRAFPTNIHLSRPDRCAYFHCHGTLCGKRDPAPDGCGHGSTTESDVGCKDFLNKYLKAAGVN